MSYYYLISGLPNLSLDSAIENKGKAQMDIDECLQTIQRNLYPAHVPAFRFLIYRNDNSNFLNVLLEKHHDIPRTGRLHPALLDREVIEAYHKNTGELPGYMGDFVSAYEDQLAAMSPREMQDKLWRAYDQEAQSSDPFIEAFVSFERQLGEFFAAYNDHYFDFLRAPDPDDTSLGTFRAGKSLSRDIIRCFPYLEAMDEIIASEDPMRIAAFTDRIIWDYLDQFSGVFGKEQVLIYTIRLMIVAKWQNRKKEAGLAQFHQLQEDIKSKVRSIKIPVI